MCREGCDTQKLLLDLLQKGLFNCSVDWVPTVLKSGKGGTSNQLTFKTWSEVQGGEDVEALEVDPNSAVYMAQAEEEDHEDQDGADAPARTTVEDDQLDQESEDDTKPGTAAFSTFLGSSLPFPPDGPPIWREHLKIFLARHSSQDEKTTFEHIFGFLDFSLHHHCVSTAADQSVQARALTHPACRPLSSLRSSGQLARETSHGLRQ